MTLAAHILVSTVAIIHVYIAIFEMFLWEKRGPKVFRSFDDEIFPKTVILAKNQGLYNAFLAAGLVWSLLIDDNLWQQRVATCFLSMVAIAGIYGALTAERRIVFVQTLPAIAAISLVWIN